MLSSNRHSQWFNSYKCPYIKRFLDLCKSLIISFRECKELTDHFEWTEELISIEKYCLVLFFENIFTKYKKPESITVENLLQDEYFNCPSYSKLQELYEEELEKANIINKSINSNE